MSLQKIVYQKILYTSQQTFLFFMKYFPVCIQKRNIQSCNI